MSRRGIGAGRPGTGGHPVAGRPLLAAPDAVCQQRRRGRTRSRPLRLRHDGTVVGQPLSSFIVVPVQVGAQLGARAVDARADRADRDAGGERDLGVGQVGPGVQQQGIAIDARHRPQRGGELWPEGTGLDPAERVLGEVVFAPSPAAHRDERRGGSGGAAGWWRCRTATGRHPA